MYMYIYICTCIYIYINCNLDPCAQYNRPMYVFIYIYTSNPMHKTQLAAQVTNTTRNCSQHILQYVEASRLYQVFTIRKYLNTKSIVLT